MKRQDWLTMVLMLMILLALGAWNRAHADIFVCADSTCSSKSTKPLASMAASDLVQWCSGGSPQPGTQNGCTAQQVIDWRQMAPYSQVMTTDGWCSVQSIPCKPQSAPPTTPQPPTNPAPTPASGSVRVTCTPGTQYTDDSPFTAAGFHLKYGTQSGLYTQIVDSKVCDVTVQLPPGTYYFAFTEYDAFGIESLPSNEASKTIDAPSDPVPNVVEIPNTWSLKKGSTNVQTGFKTYDDCKAAAIAKATSIPVKYLCTTVGGSILVSVNP